MTTRRQFLHAIGRAGGYSAAYLSMQAMGLLAMPLRAQGLDLPAGSGAGKSVVILGGGIAGLVSAYELGKAGYKVTVLEARNRVGGRVWSIRGGTKIEQIGREDQLCRFEDGLYFNAGAARLPTHHHAIWHYVRELNVPMEVMVNVNRSAKVDVGGVVVTERQAVNDARGRIAELLNKALDRGALDGEVNGADKAALRAYLAEWGVLDTKGAYAGGEPSGFAEPMGGYAAPGRLMDPLTLDQLATHGFWAAPAVFEETFDQQAPMFQPVGGMDRIAYAIYERVKPMVRLETPVKAMKRTAKGVRVTTVAGDVVEADYCLCCLPANYLAKLDTDLSPAKKAALANAQYAGAAKVAWQTPRFWEEEGIYGGLSWTDQPSQLVWYPSGHWNDKGKAVLVGAYAFGAPAFGRSGSEFVSMPFEERFAISRGVIERMHPGKSALLELPLTVSWGETLYSGGVGCLWSDAQRKTDYVELCRPEDRIFFAGEHLSYIPFWQEGAALSAHEALRLLQTRAAADRLTEKRAA